MLTEIEKQLLLSVARHNISAAVIGKPYSETKNIPETHGGPHGAFVTLYKNGELRGCIGYLTGTLPLLETVKEVAEKAALSDPRFSPLTEEEVSQIIIEISILSPMKLIQRIEEIQIGLHGLLIEGPHGRGILLPKVAAEYGWNLETFLRETSRKAGGPPDLWKKPDVRIYTFTAEVIRE